MENSKKLKALKLQIKELEQKKPTLTDAAEIKAINKQINALQMEYCKLREEMKYHKSFEQSIEREFIHSMVGDD